MAHSYWGENFWGVNQWGDQEHLDVIPTGIEDVIQVPGDVTINADAVVIPTGIQNNAITGQVTEEISFEIILSGLEEAISQGTVDPGPDANAQGQEIEIQPPGQVTIDDQFLIGAGWGRDTWGSMAWGVNYSVIIADGLALTIASGEEDTTGNAIVDLTALPMTLTLGQESLRIDADLTIFGNEPQLNSYIEEVVINATATVDITGIGQDITQGEAIGGTIQQVDVTGIFDTIFTHPITVSANADVDVTGISLVGNMGETVIGIGVPIDGISAVMNVGDPTFVISGSVTLTGIGLTVRVGSANVFAWAEVDTGTQVTWTPVDLAA
jgi:hypothetical protein